MANRARGEYAIEIEDRPYTLCLTLGALAEIEDKLGIETADQMGERLARVGFRDMLVILGALLRGGGHEIDDAELARLQVDLPRLGEWLQGVFRAAGWEEGGAANPTPPESPSDGAGSSDSGSA